MESKCKDSSSCDLCNVELGSIQEQLEHDFSLIHHMKLHQKHKNQVHSCSLCSREVGSIKSYISHLHGSKHQEFLINQRKFWEKNTPTKVDLKHRCHVVKIDLDRSKGKQFSNDKSSPGLQSIGNPPRWDRNKAQVLSSSSSVGPKNDQEQDKQFKNPKHINSNIPFVPGGMGKPNSFPRQPYNQENDRRNPKHSNYFHSFNHPRNYNGNQQQWFQNQPNRFQNYQNRGANFQNYQGNQNHNYWDWQTYNPHSENHFWEQNIGGLWFDTTSDWDKNRNSNALPKNMMPNSNPQANIISNTCILVGKDTSSSSDLPVTKKAEVFVSKLQSGIDENELKKKKSSKKVIKNRIKSFPKLAHKSEMGTTRSVVEMVQEVSVDSNAENSTKEGNMSKLQVRTSGQKSENTQKKFGKKVIKEECLKTISPMTESNSKNPNRNHMYFLSSDSDIEDHPSNMNLFLENAADKINVTRVIEKSSEGQYNKDLLNRLVNFPCTRKQQAQLAKWVQEHSKRKKKLVLPRFNMHVVSQSASENDEDVELRKVLSQMMSDLPDDTIDALVDVLKRDNNETDDQQDLELILVPQEEEQCDVISESKSDDTKSRRMKDLKFNFTVPEFQEEEPEVIVPDFHKVVIKDEPDSNISPSNDRNKQSPLLPDRPPREHQTDISHSSPNILSNSPLGMSRNNSLSPRSKNSKSPIIEKMRRNSSSSQISMSNSCSSNQSKSMKSSCPPAESNHMTKFQTKTVPVKLDDKFQRNIGLITEKPIRIQSEAQEINADEDYRFVELDHFHSLQTSHDQDSQCRMNGQQKEKPFKDSSQSVNTHSIESDHHSTETDCPSSFLFPNSDLHYTPSQELKKLNSCNPFSLLQAPESTCSFNNVSKPQQFQDGLPDIINPAVPLNHPHSTNFSTHDKKCPSPQTPSASQQNWSEFPSWIQRPSPDPSPSERISVGGSKDPNLATESAPPYSIVDQLLQLSKEEEDLRDKSLKIDNIIVDIYKVLEEWKIKRVELQQEEIQMRNKRFALLQELQGSLTKEGNTNNVIFSAPEVSSSTSKVGTCSSTTQEAETQNVTYLGTLDSTWQLIQELGLNFSDEVDQSTLDNTARLMESFSVPEKKSKKKVSESTAKKMSKKPPVKVPKKAPKQVTKATQKLANEKPTRKRKVKDSISAGQSKEDTDSPKIVKKSKKKDAILQANLQDLLNHLIKKEVGVCSTGNKGFVQRQNMKAPQVSSSSNVSELESVEHTDKVQKMETISVETFGPLEAHESAILDIKVANGFIYTCSADKTTKRFQIKDPSNCCVYRDHDKTVTAIQIITSEKGQDQLFTGSHDGYLRCFDSQSGQLITEQFTGSSILCMTKGWGKLYLGLNNGDVLPYKVNAAKFLEKLAFSQSSVSKIVTGTEGLQRLLCVITYDGTVSVRNADSGLLIHLLESKVRPPCCLLLDGSEVFITTTDRKILVHDLTSGRLLRSATCLSSATGLHLVGDYVVSCSFDGFIRCYLRKTWTLHRVYYGAGKGMTMCMDISDGWMYTANRHGIVEGLKSDHKTKALCSFQECNYPFGIWEDLRHHISTDHLKSLSSKSVLTWTDCPWKNCNFLLMGTTGQEKLMELQQHIFHHVQST